MTAHFRVGQGFDAHRFAGDPDRPLVLAGVTLPDGPGLDGHSDGDVVVHAVVDALLGAAALGDLGSVFGSARSEYAGAASAVFATETRRLLDTGGWAVGNLDCTVVAARPRLAPHRPTMTASLAAMLGLEQGAVSIKVTSTDGLGWTGRGEGIACLAVALLVPR